jgi:predicted acyltransferase
MSTEATAQPDPKKPQRLASLDAYRGFVMLLMAGEVLRFGAVAEKIPDSGFWKFLAHHQDHVEWQGCVLHDLIQPSFSFLVGMALPWSLASREGRGDSFLGMFFHTLWRSFALIALGIFLRSTHASQTNFTFEDTLTQIGLGYTFLWLLALRSVRLQVAALVAILVGYWAWFAFSALPPAGFDPATVGVSADWMREHGLSGFAAHWNKNANPAHDFDVWFLNLLPRAKPFLFNGGGYLTLSFIPTLGTMILGLLAGGWMRREDVPVWRRVGMLAAAGFAGLGAGWLLDITGAAPVVKRIWTPGWVIFSGGWCCLLMAGFYAVTDALGFKAWAFPLRVIGMNSIFTYVTVHLWEGFFKQNLKIHLGRDIWTNLGGLYAPVLEGAVVLGIFWLMCFWLYRKKLFIRV